MQKKTNTDNGKEKTSLTNRTEHDTYYRYIKYYFLIPFSILLILAYLIGGFDYFISLSQLFWVNLFAIILLLAFTVTLSRLYDMLNKINTKDFTKFSTRNSSEPFYHVENFFKLFLSLAIYFFICAFFFSLIGGFNSNQVLVMAFFAVIIIRLSHYWNKKYGKEVGNILAQFVIPFGIILFIGKYSPITVLIDFLQGHILEFSLSIIIILFLVLSDILGMYYFREIKSVKNLFNIIMKKIFRQVK